MSRRGGGLGAWARLRVVLAVVVFVAVAAFAGYVASHGPGQSPGDPAAERWLATHTPEPEPIPPTVAFIGDSYTKGVGSMTGGWVNDLRNRYGWSIRNFGQGATGYMLQPEQDPDFAQKACGKDYCPTYREVIQDVAKARPTAVFVSGGRNDIYHSDADLQRGIRVFFAELREALPRTPIFAVSPFWDDDKPAENLPVIAAAVRDGVERVGGQYLDIGLPLVGKTDLIADDTVHPDEEGYAVISALIEKRLDALGAPDELAEAAQSSTAP